MVILDTSAWIELFEGTQIGMKVKNIIEEDQCYTSITTLAEIATWCTKNNLDINSYIEIIEKNTLVLNLKKSVVLSAGKLVVERKKKFHNWGIMDAFIYQTAKLYKLRVITKDPHFKGLEGVELLE
ncbi:MAG: PIN domain-containing protein [Nanoarchaeota archaeon]